MTNRTITRVGPGQAALPRYVEIETSRKCNRTCSWCPNSEHLVRKVQELMPWELFSRIVGELGFLGYSGWLAFHNYNEPLLNGRILDEIRLVKAAMPASRPAIYTNGDTLDYQLFDRLVMAGVEYIRVTRYPHRADTPPSFPSIKRWLHRAGLLDAPGWEYRTVRQGLAAVLQSGRLKVEVISPGIIDTYNTRGGAVTTLPLLTINRTEPCLMTSTSAVIDYRGRVKMCCCVYPEAEEHARYVVGDLHVSTFADLWGSASMAAYRLAHGAADWSLSPACRGCAQSLPETRR